MIVELLHSTPLNVCSRNDFLKSEKAINLEYAKDECDSRTHKEGYCLGEILQNKKNIMSENK